MTIDDCIKRLLINKEDDTYVLGNETIDFAISTMRKYQKIKKIVENNNGFTDGTLEHSKAFTKIVEVVEDGNDII